MTSNAKRTNRNVRRSGFFPTIDQLKRHRWDLHDLVNHGILDPALLLAEFRRKMAQLRAGKALVGGLEGYRLPLRLVCEGAALHACVVVSDDGLEVACTDQAALMSFVESAEAGREEWWPAVYLGMLDALSATAHQCEPLGHTVLVENKRLRIDAYDSADCGNADGFEGHSIH